MNWFAHLSTLRAEHRLDELDAAYASAPPEVQRDLGIASIWVSVPRIRNDVPEMRRRADALIAEHPDDPKGYSHLVFALARTEPWDELKPRLVEWDQRWGWGVLGPIAIIALGAEDYDYAVSIWERMAVEQPEMYEAGTRRMHVIALARSGRRDAAARLLAEARAAFPDFRHFDGLGV
jgi:hypothetical protein